MNVKRIAKWVIVLFLLAALPGMTAALAQGQEPAGKAPLPAVVEPGESAAPSTWSEVEVEPNNSIAQANRIWVGDIMRAVANPAGDVDFFKFLISQHNTTILIDTDANSLNPSSPMDTVVTLYDASGNEVSSNDDVNPPDRDSLLYRGLNPGWWYIKVRNFRADLGGADYVYQLNLSSPLLISAHAQNLGTGNVAGISFRSEDILAWSDLFYAGEEKWVMFFDASDVGWTKPLWNLSRGWIGTTNAASLGAGFSANQNVVDYQGITRTVKPWDWIVFNLDQIGPNSAVSGIEYHSGTIHGLTTTAEKVDALSLEDYYNYPQHRVDMYFSTTGTAAIPGPSGTLKPADEDLFQTRWTGGSTNVNSLFFDGSRVVGLAAEDVIAASYYEPYNDMYVTILGTGNIAGHPVSQKDIFRIDLPGHTWGSLVWHGPDHGWNYNIDAFDYPGGW